MQLSGRYRSRMARSDVSTRWRNAAITSAGRKISSWCDRPASTICATGPPITGVTLGTAGTTGPSPMRLSRSCGGCGSYPITDLCHFGVPDWIGNFQNPDWPELFGEYAGAFARRFPWVRFYTPVNEIFVTATVLGRVRLVERAAGLGPELRHRLEASVPRPICWRKQPFSSVQPTRMFIQSESSEYFHAARPGRAGPRRRPNHKRFLSLDLSYGHDVTRRHVRVPDG